MNKDNIIKKYIDDMVRKPRFILSDKSIVVGEEIDENNKLHYVILKNGKYFIDYAGKHRPVFSLIQNKSQTIKIKSKMKIKPKIKIVKKRI
jgi:hypothetical protein